MARPVTADGGRHLPPPDREAAGDEGTDSATESHDRRGRYHLGGRSGYRERQPLPDDQARVGEAEGLPRLAFGIRSTNAVFAATW